MKDAIRQQALLLVPPRVADDQPTATNCPDFGLDPLDFVELVLQVEKQFGIRFSTAELTELRTVQVALSGVERPLRQSLYADFFAKLLLNGTWL
jgi:acyl carrier protein